MEHPPSSSAPMSAPVSAPISAQPDAHGEASLASQPWWIGDALTAGPRGLELDGVALADVAKKHGTPVYVYGARSVRRRVGELRAALGEVGAPFRIHCAMKAARFGPVLDVLRREGTSASTRALRARSGARSKRGSRRPRSP